MQNEIISKLGSYSQIAFVFLEYQPTAHIHYGFSHEEHCYVLMVEHSGLYLRDVRELLSDNITVKYGNTLDTIIFIDSKSETNFDRKF